MFQKDNKGKFLQIVHLDTPLNLILLVLFFTLSAIKQVWGLPLQGHLLTSQIKLSFTFWSFISHRHLN